MTFSRPAAPEITAEIFDNMARDEDDFAAHVRKHYTRLCWEGGYEPVFNDRRLYDAWIAFQRDKDHAVKSLPPYDSECRSADHFKLCGVLAYWLRRFAPVYDLRDLSMVRDAPEALTDLLKKYPSEFSAFDLGVSVCDFFERHKKENPCGVPAIGKSDNFNYHKSVCYLMNFKSLSPHSLGMIYRSLYVPVGAAR